MWQLISLLQKAKAPQGSISAPTSGFPPAWWLTVFKTAATWPLGPPPSTRHPHPTQGSSETESCFQTAVEIELEQGISKMCALSHWDFLCHNPLIRHNTVYKGTEESHHREWNKDRLAASVLFCSFPGTLIIAWRKKPPSLCALDAGVDGVCYGGSLEEEQPTQVASVHASAFIHIQWKGKIPGGSF